MEKRLGMLLFLDLNYGNSSGKEKTWHISTISKYADPVGERDTHTQKRPCYAWKTSGEGKKIKICEVWNCLCLSPDVVSWEQLRVADASVSNASQTGLLHGSSGHSFHSSLNWPSWGEGLFCRQGCEGEQHGHGLAPRRSPDGSSPCRSPSDPALPLQPTTALPCLPFTCMVRDLLPRSSDPTQHLSGSEPGQGFASFSERRVGNGKVGSACPRWAPPGFPGSPHIF